MEQTVNLKFDKYDDDRCMAHIMSMITNNDFAEFLRDAFTSKTCKRSMFCTLRYRIGSLVYNSGMVYEYSELWKRVEMTIYVSDMMCFSKETLSAFPEIHDVFPKDQYGTFRTNVMRCEKRTTIKIEFSKCYLNFVFNFGIPATQLKSSDESDAFDAADALNFTKSEKIEMIYYSNNDNKITDS